MFNRKECLNCNRKISNKYNFCPCCGSQIRKSTSEDWGMLGKEDNKDEFEEMANSLFGGGLLNKMLGGAIKMVEKEMQRELKKQNSFPKTKFQLFINKKKVDLNGIPNMVQNQNKHLIKQRSKNISSIHFSEKNQKKYQSLPKGEPKTNIRRLSNKIFYEIETPGIKSIEDVSIIKLENSIEIRALAKNKAYLKILQVNLPLTGYSLNREKIVLELESENL
jgi:HSP20 family molecular chaperone IbpA